MRAVTSRQNPVIRACRDAAVSTPGDGRPLLLEGAHLIREACDAGVVFDMVLVAASKIADASEEGGLAHACDRRGVDVVEVPDAVFAAASPVRTPSGLLALARPCPAPAADAIFRDPRAFVVAAVDVQDPGNVGAILRVAEAGGATAACVCGASAHPFSWRGLRGAMGSAFRLSVLVGGSPLDRVREMREAGLQTIAAVPRSGRDPDALDWRRPAALLLGGEGAGLSDAVVARCDARVSVPMAGAVESLNVAAAAAVLVYAARRQRA